MTLGQKIYYILAELKQEEPIMMTPDMEFYFNDRVGEKLMTMSDKEIMDVILKADAATTKLSK